MAKLQWNPSSRCQLLASRIYRRANKKFLSEYSHSEVTRRTTTRNRVCAAWERLLPEMVYSWLTSGVLFAPAGMPYVRW